MCFVEPKLVKLFGLNLEANEHVAPLNIGRRPLDWEHCADGGFIVDGSLRDYFALGPQQTSGGGNSTREALTTSVNGQRLCFCSDASEANAPHSFRHIACDMSDAISASVEPR